MKRVNLHLAILSGLVLLVGCQSPKFVYKAPPPSYSSSGPTIQIMPITDDRTNRAMDKVLEKGYFVDVQRAIADELSSMNIFRSVSLATNISEPVTTNLKLNPAVRRLEWEIPKYDKLLTEAFAVGLLTGLAGGTVFCLTKVDVYGHSVIDVRLDQIAQQRVLIDAEYSATVTNRLKKGVCDTPSTKAKMMVQAFQQTMTDVKADIQNKLPEILETTNSPTAVSKER